MDRNIYKYNMAITTIDIPNRPNVIEFENEFDRFLEFFMDLQRVERKKELLKTDKVIYLEEYTKNQRNDINIYYLKFVSLKYNQAREVLNKETLESRGILKDINDGDKELNHVVIKEYAGNIKAAFEYNYYGLQRLETIIGYLNDKIEEYFKTLNIDRYYMLEAHPEINRDFIRELNRMTQINAATIVIETNRLGNTLFGNLSGRQDVKDEVEITLKKAKRKNISREIIEQYYNNNIDNNGIKRMYILGKNENNKVRLDTEEMKQKEKITVEENHFGEINSNEIFRKLEEYLMEV